VNHDELYREGMRPQRFGWLVRPIRRVLFRLLRPFLLALAREQEGLADGLRGLDPRLADLERGQRVAGDALDGIAPHLTEVERRQREFERRLAVLEDAREAMDARAQSASSVAWDREAIARRLAALEDALAEDARRRSG
jgi:hypothetical protein